MLTLILGKAGAGKTAAIINEIRVAVQRQETHRMLIVPEQYSHEAERELCRACGDTMSQYAEVFNFTSLARRLRSQLGGNAAKYLDKGGRLLCMALAAGSVGSRLRVYSAAAHKSELQEMLLSAVDELKAACITPEALMALSREYDDSLGDKLFDLALIAEAYDAIVANGHADPSDALTLLAQQIPNSNIDATHSIYIDGFVDFTMQELQVIRALINTGASVTVCLTVDSLYDGSEVFALSRRSAHILVAMAEESGVEHTSRVINAPNGKSESLQFFADNMFSYSAASCNKECDITLMTADSINVECELAAAKAIALARDEGARWRDIAVAVRGFDDYRVSLESIFRHYGVPLFAAKKSELLHKPLPQAISLVYEIIGSGWDIDDVISYMHTGLTGLTQQECDELEAYIFKWQLHGSAWSRKGNWQQHPDGYGAEYDEETEERLAHINELRHRLSDPLLQFADDSEKAQTAAEHAVALATLFGTLKLPEMLEARAEALSREGREVLAQEYVQLWGIVVGALEQSAAILGDMPMESDEFGKLFNQTLSKYDVGTIPVSLDAVSAGDFDRVRRRNIKHLIVLGASDERLPRAESGVGVFSSSERTRLSESGIDIGGNEGELWREFSLIYNCLSLPSKTLVLIYPLTNTKGEGVHPAFIFNRAAALFGLTATHGRVDAARMAAPSPALSLAAGAVRGGTGVEHAAAEYFAAHDSAHWDALNRAADMSRGKLSEATVRRLYGERLRLSASRIDKFASCKYAYFCQYGLRAKPYKPAGLTPPEIGTFTHFVLEKTAREVKSRGGWKEVADDALMAIADSAVAEYIHAELNDFQEKSARFTYLFRRLTRDVRQIVADMAAELRTSDFEPLDFELNFGAAQNLPPVELGEGENSLQVTGIADRVDGWYHNGKLYLRVVDYKTGKKEFKLADIWYGRGLQMLLYLFTLEKGGEKLYGCETVPAGVMYVPARNAIASLNRDDDEEIEKQLNREMRRSGLVLDDNELMEAWEHGAKKKYIPVTFSKSGIPSPDHLASTERLGHLAKHIKKCLADMAQELRQGNVAADPYYRGQNEFACANCDYINACHFANGENGESCRYLTSLSADKVWAMLEEEADNE